MLKPQRIIFAFAMMFSRKCEKKTFRQVYCCSAEEIGRLQKCAAAILNEFHKQRKQFHQRAQCVREL